MRFGAKLLFQFRRLDEDDAPRRRVVEVRIVNFDAADAEEAYARALRLGEEEQFAHTVGKQAVALEFVGLLQLQDLAGLEPEEVWSELEEMDAPMERAQELLPEKKHLLAFEGPPARPGRLGLLDPDDD